MAVAQLRHKSMNSSLRYIRVDVEERKGALERMGQEDSSTHQISRVEIFSLSIVMGLRFIA